MRKMNKRGVFDNLVKIGVGLAAFAVVIVVGFLIMAEAQDQIVSIQNINETADAGTSAYNASRTTQEALEDVPDWLPIIIVVAIGALLIGLIATFRRGRT